MVVGTYTLCSSSKLAVKSPRKNTEFRAHHWITLITSSNWFRWTYKWTELFYPCWCLQQIEFFQTTRITADRTTLKLKTILVALKPHRDFFFLIMSLLLFQMHFQISKHLNVYNITEYYLFINNQMDIEAFFRYGLVGLGCRIHRQYLYSIPTAMLELCAIPLRCHRSQVHFRTWWQQLIGSCRWVK